MCSYIVCLSTIKQQGSSKSTTSTNKSLIATSASAGCQTINTSGACLQSTNKDPLALTPPGASAAHHPSVATIRVKSGLRLNDRDSAITLTPSAAANTGSSPPGLCKIGSSGVTANSRPLQVRTVQGHVAYNFPKPASLYHI
jgi:hypothetical protein